MVVVWGWAGWHRSVISGFWPSEATRSDHKLEVNLRDFWPSETMFQNWKKLWGYSSVRRPWVQYSVLQKLKTPIQTKTMHKLQFMCIYFIWKLTYINIFTQKQWCFSLILETQTSYHHIRFFFFFLHICIISYFNW